MTCVRMLLALVAASFAFSGVYAGGAHHQKAAHHGNPMNHHGGHMSQPSHGMSASGPSAPTGVVGAPTLPHGLSLPGTPGAGPPARSIPSTDAASAGAAGGACSNTAPEGDAKCEEWAGNDECNTNKFFMRVQCAAACGTCGCTVDKAGEDVAPCLPTAGGADSSATTTTAASDTTTTTAEATTTTAATTTTTEAATTTTAAATTTTAADDSTTTTAAAADDTAATTTAAGATGDCQNTAKPGEVEFCNFWQSVGECEKNPNYMKKYCAQSCNSCAECEGCSGATHSNNNGHSNMGHTGGASHGNTGGSAAGGACADTAVVPDNPTPGAFCAFWSSEGECEKNPSYMKMECKKSCGMC